MNWQAIWDGIKVLLSELWVELWPTLKIMLTEQGKLAFATAKNIVLNIAETMPNATGQEKFEAALAQLTAALAAQGVQMGIGILRLCIEIAYQHMKAEPEVIQEAKDMMQVEWHPPVEP